MRGRDRVMRTVLIILFLVWTVFLYQVSRFESDVISVWRYSVFALFFVVVSVMIYAFIVYSILFFDRNKSLLQNIWLCIGSLVFAFVGIDLILRFFLTGFAGEMYLPDPILHHKLEPNASRFYWNPEFKAWQRTDENGFRNEHPVRRAGPDTYRIMMLGDSFTMGVGVRTGETFSGVVEAKLNGRQQKKIEVINAGVNSYAPILSYLQFKTQGIQYDPDLVVLNLDMSDLVQETFLRRQAVYSSDGDPVAVKADDVKPKLSNQIEKWIHNHLYVTSYLFWRFRSLVDSHVSDYILTERNFNLMMHTLEGDDQDRSQQWEDLFDSIRRIRKFCEEHRISFFLSVYPWGHQVHEREWIPGRWKWVPKGSRVSDRSLRTIRELCEKYDIDRLDAFPAFRGYNGEKLLYYKDDMPLYWVKHSKNSFTRVT